MRSTHTLCVLGLMLAAIATRAPAAELSRTVAAPGMAEHVDFKAVAPRSQTLPGGDKAWRFDDAFEFRIDLKPQKVEAREYDLIKLEVKADRGAFLRIAVENHPRPGDMSYWYVLDSMRGPLDWQTVWVDLRLPEEVKSGDDKRSPWREGLTGDEKDHRGVRIQGKVTDLKSARQGDGRSISIGDVRFVKESVHLDWDQTQAPYTWAKGQDLVFTYPLTVTNKLGEPIQARLNLTPIDVPHATASAGEQPIALAAGETKTVPVTLTLPAAIAAEKPELYCERFLATAEAVGVRDSTVTILRSSDPIHLTVTVPIAEEKLKGRLFPRPRTLPQSVTQFDQSMAREHAAKDPQKLIDTALRHGLYQYGSDSDPHGVGQYRQSLVSAAYLYDLTGDAQHLQTARRLLGALPAIWSKWSAAEQKEPVQIISNGVVARWGQRSHYTLGLGWLVVGTQRSPYYYGASGNGRGGSMSSLAYAFDIVAPQLDEAERQKIIDGFFLPAGIQARNHYIGDGNQQMTADLTAMYAGLLTRNWPLVSFAYSSEHGLEGVIETSFDDDGVQLRKNYQTYTLRPLFWTTELLYGAGHNVYKRHADRLRQLATADPLAKNQGAPFEDTELWQFIDEQRLR